MTGTHNEYGNRVMSTLEFFNSLKRGQLVRSGLYGSPLVYTNSWKETTMRHTAILVTQLLSEPVFVDIDNDGRSWSLVVDENNNEPMMVCPDTCYAIEQYIAEMKGNTNLHDTIMKLRSDIQRINDALNKAAEQYNWCDAYEDHLHELNQTLTAGMTLIGREKERDVRVVLRAEWAVWIPIESTSEEDAVSQVKAMNPFDLYDKAIEIQCSPDDVEVIEVET